MLLRLIPVLLIGLAVAIYHVGTKGLGKSLAVGPWTLLASVYFAAFFIALSIGCFAQSEHANLTWRAFTAAWPFVLLVALGCIGIEGGYLFAYRAGWKVTELMPFTALANSFAIAGIGILIFQESVSIWNVVGLTLVIFGATIFQWS